MLEKFFSKKYYDACWACPKTCIGCFCFLVCTTTGRVRTPRTRTSTVDEDDHDRRHVCLLCSAVAPPAAFTAGLLTPRHRGVLSATSRGLGRIRNRPSGSAWRARSSRDEGYHPRRARPAGRQSPALGPSWSDLDRTEGIRSICGANLARCLQRFAAGASLAALDSSI